MRGQWFKGFELYLRRKWQVEGGARLLGQHFFKRFRYAHRLGFTMGLRRVWWRKRQVEEVWLQL